MAQHACAREDWKDQVAGQHGQVIRVAREDVADLRGGDKALMQWVGDTRAGGVEVDERAVEEDG